MRGMAWHAPTVNDGVRIVFVIGPFYGIFNSVFADAIHFFFTAYDVFIIIALP